MVRLGQLLMAVVTFVHLQPNIVLSNSELRIGGIFPSQTSPSYLAAKIAITDLKQNNFDPPIEVQDVFFNISCGLLEYSEMSQLVQSEPDISIWLSDCHIDCIDLVDIISTKDSIVICYGISLPDDILYFDHNVYTAEAQQNSIATAYTRFIKVYNWKRIFVVYQNITYYDNMKARLIHALEDDECRVTVLEVKDPTEVANTLKKEDARIIIWLSETDWARIVMCDNYKSNWYGEKYVWMFPGSFEKNWYMLGSEEEHSCTHTEMRKAANGHFVAKPLNWNKDDVKTVSGTTVRDFKGTLHEQLEHLTPDYNEAPLAYDSVWAAVLGYRIAVDSLAKNGHDDESSESLKFPYRGLITESLKEVSFTGMSGNFGFTTDGDRRMADTIVDIYQYKYVNNSRNQYKSIGQFTIKPHFGITFSTEPFDPSKIPSDSENYITTSVAPTLSSTNPYDHTQSSDKPIKPPSTSIGVVSLGERAIVIAVLTVTLIELGA